MIVYQNYDSFTVLDVQVNVISDETDYGLNTVVEIGDQYSYLGNEPSGVMAAIFGWQDINGRDLTNQELDKVLFENK